MMNPAYVASLKLTEWGDISGILRELFASSEKTYSFLRWPHQVSGIQSGIVDDFTCQEGQIFSREHEVRWRKIPRGYHLLYLGIQHSPPALTALPGRWAYEDYSAALYGNKRNQETRFPKTFNYPKDLVISQRYFVDAITARVHFIALIPR